MGKEIRVSYDKILKDTGKAILIKFLDHTTWIPSRFATIRGNYILVPEWLHEKLDWKPDYEDLDFCMTSEEVEEMGE